MISNIETERLVIRPFKKKDASFILSLLNTPTWLRFIGDRNIKNKTDAKNYLLNGPMTSYRINNFGLSMVELKNQSVPIGMCGLIKRETLDDIDIGFAFMPEYIGMGYGYEAATATMYYAKNDLQVKRVVAITDPENINSIHLIKKLGMQFEKMITLDSDKELLFFGIEMT